MRVSRAFSWLLIALSFFPRTHTWPFSFRKGSKAAVVSFAPGNGTASGAVQYVGTSSNVQRRYRETLSWKPRASLIHNFLTEKECDHLVNLVRKKIKRSSVVDPVTGKTRTDAIRTSSGSSVAHGNDPVVVAVEERASRWTHIPPEHGETMQILKYEHGEKYGSHWDFFSETQPGQQSKGKRIATLLMYLSDVEEGGETAFKYGKPLSNNVHTAQSSCTGQGVAVHPKKGDALFFWDMKPDQITPDRSSMHDGCPVIAGEKWSATIWFRSIPMRATSKSRNHCVDYDDRCPTWAAMGECDTNPLFMRDRAQSVCPKSCRVC